MRYQSGMTDLAHPLRGLGPTEVRLAGVLARPRVVAWACVVGLTALGWLALGVMARPTSISWLAACRPAAAADWTMLALALPMWVTMVLAMMLPTAGPMILTYAEIAHTAAGRGEAVVSPLILAAGYLVVWLGFAAVAALLQTGLAKAGLLRGDSVTPPLAGMILVAAGLYQFSALKRACLSLCQHPFPFFFANWTTERSGVWRLGLRQGLYCAGCCWALMVLMFAAGVMNVVWMATLGALMAAEKVVSGRRFSHAIGALLIALGLGLLSASVW
jgi:predicted metal-binding membrane protein